MAQFFFKGFLFGIIFIGALSFILPIRFVGVQQELVKQGHGTYHPTTREFILKECK